MPQRRSPCTVIADISTPENRGRNLSLHLGSLLVGVSIGPAVGGVTAEIFNLQAPFYLVGFLSLICAIWAFRVVPETSIRPGTTAAGAEETAQARPKGAGGLRPWVFFAGIIPTIC